MPAYYLKFRIVSALMLVYCLMLLVLLLVLTRPIETNALVGKLQGDTPLPNFVDIRHIPDRKQAFVDLLLPMAREKNINIQNIRQVLYEIQAQLQSGKQLKRRNRVRLERLASRYDLERDSQSDLIEQLLERVDVIPESMLLAQAAAESGWGTSRFAREANNLFGQWCYREGCGIVPGERRAGAQHEVQRFASVEQALDSYYHNINTHRAYGELRALRQRLRETGEPITGPELIATLLNYSERGEAYVQELQELIRFNDFLRYDDAG
jgi:Bax protein